MTEEERLKSIKEEVKIENRTDSGNAFKFASMFKDKVRFDHRRGRWLVWDKHRWIDDKGKSVKMLAIEMARTRYLESVNIQDNKARISEAKWAVASEGKSKIDACLDLAKSIKPIADLGGGWDTNPMLLSCNNGIIDLTIGKIRDGKPEDAITMSTNMDYEGSATCPKWIKFINEIFFEDQEIIHYVQKALGYSITGMTKEQVAFFCFGSGANGKSVLFKTISSVLGDYAHDAPSSLFQRNAFNTSTNDVAATEFKRFLVSSETLSSTKINEQRLKKWTGGDTESARYLYGEYFSFEPTVKPWLFINHKPQVEDDSFGFWRRVRLIPFERTFAQQEQNQNLLSELKEESAGILNWLIEGCLMWQSEGLRPVPEKVNLATQAYQADNDVLADFIFSRCHLDNEWITKSRSLYNSYVDWCGEEGIQRADIISSTDFGRRMGDKFPSVRRKEGIYYKGIKLWSGDGGKKEGVGVGFEENLGSGVGLDPFFSKVSTRENLQGDFTKNDPQPYTQVQNFEKPYTDVNSLSEFDTIIKNLESLK